MSHSLNEIETMAKRAARGAGLSWGMAEDAARACRWLVSHDLPGVTQLADVLTLNDGVPHHQVAPRALAGIWASASGMLCPLAGGATLNDCADQLQSGQGIEMSNLSYPLLVVPFAAWAAVHISTPVTVSWLGTTVATDGNRIWIDDPQAQINLQTAATLTCARAPRIDTRAIAPAMRGKVCPSAWARLNAFAHRTYAPSTPDSRRLGAGAGASDND